MCKIILSENQLVFYFQMNFIFKLYANMYAECNGPISGSCQIELGSSYLLWQFIQCHPFLM